MKSFYLFFLFLPCIVSAQQEGPRLDFEDHAFPEFVTSARALALGNAYLNKVDDSWAAFYNPAGLGTIRKFRFHLLNFHLEGNKGFFDATGGAAEQIPNNVQEVLTADGLRERMVDNQGQLAHARANFFPAVSFRYFTFGYMYSRRTRAYLGENSVAPIFELADRRDHGPVAAANVSLWGGVFKLGVSAVYLSRSELIQQFDATQEIRDDALTYAKGRSLQVTAGSRLTLPFEGLPTFSAVFRNASNDEFETNGPQDIPQTIDIGASVTPMLGKRTRMHIEINFKDLYDEYDTDSKRRFGAGVEFDFARQIFFRLGYGDGFGAGGVGIRSKKLIVDLSTYAVDTSTEEFRGEEDRRFVMSISSGF